MARISAALLFLSLAAGTGAALADPPLSAASSSVVSSGVNRTQATLTLANIHRHLDTLNSRPQGAGRAATPAPALVFNGTSSEETEDDAWALNGVTTETLSRRQVLRRFANDLRVDSADGSLNLSRYAVSVADSEEMDLRAGFNLVPSGFSIWAYGTDAALPKGQRVGGPGYGGDVISFNTGVDRRFADYLVGGLSFGYTTSDARTGYNTGVYEEDSYTVAPYLLLRLSDWLRLSGAVGASMGEIEQTRRKYAVSSVTGAESYFGDLTAQAQHRLRGTGLMFKARGGFTRSVRMVDGFIESDGTERYEEQSNLSQVHYGGETSYDLRFGRNTFQPFVAADGLRDFLDVVGDQPRAAEVTSGLRYRNPALRMSGFVESVSRTARWRDQGPALRAHLDYSFDVGGFDTPARTYVRGENTDTVLKFGTGVTFTDAESRVRMGFDASRRSTTTTGGVNNDLRTMATLAVTF